MEPFSGRQHRQVPTLRESTPPTSRPEPPVEKVSTPVVQSEVRTTHANRTTPTPKRLSRKRLAAAVAAVAAIVLLLWVFAMFRGMGGGVPGVDSSKYQAVFLRDKYVYIGKLTDAGNGYYRLTHVFYPQASDGTSDTKAANTQLVKLGNDLLGASDEMMIARSHVISYENLKDDGQAAKAIQAYLNKN